MGAIQNYNRKKLSSMHLFKNSFNKDMLRSNRGADCIQLLVPAGQPYKQTSFACMAHDVGQHRINFC